MPYGLRTYDATGNTLLDYTSRLTRVLFKKKLGKDASGSKVVAGYDNTKGIAFAVLAGGNTYFVDPHRITVSGTTVTWTPETITTYRGESWLFVIMYK